MYSLLLGILFHLTIIIFFFFLSFPLARIYCGLPFKVHEVLIILGLGIQQRGPRLGEFILTL